MSDQPASSSTKSAPATPSSSNQPGKTQVFILTPDILKKLGIASKIPNLTKSNPITNVSTAQAKKYDNNLGDNMKTKLAIVLNKKINESNETKNVAEATKCDNVEETTKLNEKEENSVKTKLLSMLTSKLEKGKSTSSSVEFRNDKQTTNFINQFKPKESNTLNENETTLLHVDENKKPESTISKTETEMNESCKHNIKTKLNEIDTKHETETNKNESIKKLQSTNITQTNAKELIDTGAKPSVESTRLLKNILSGESEIIAENTKTANTNLSNLTDSKGNSNNKTCITDAEKLIKPDKVESKITNNESEQESDATNLEKLTPKGRKRKITEESPAEDPELISPVRKSGRKRKLSTLHSDFVTELKLHDGSSKKLPNKARKSIEMKLTENTNENITKDITNLIENNNVNASVNQSQTMESNNDIEKVAEVKDKTNNPAENDESEKHNKSEKNQNDQTLAYEINLTNNALESNNSGILINESNNNAVQQLTTDSPSPSSINKSSTELNKQVQGNVSLSPKKQIIIHENILIKSPTTINRLNNEIVKKSLIEHLSDNDATDSSVTNKTTDILIRKEATLNDAVSLTNFGSKIKTYPGKVKRRLPVDAKHTLDSQKLATTADTPTKCISVQSVTAVLSDSSLNSEVNQIVEAKPDTMIKTDRPKMDALNDLTSETVITLTQETNKEIKSDAAAGMLSSSTQETAEKLKSPETIVLVRRRRSRPGKDNSASNTNIPIQKLNSANLSEFENFYSSTIVTKTNTSQSNEKENTEHNLLTNFTKTTPVTTDTETIDSSIENTETKSTQNLEDINEKQKVLTNFETSTTVTTSIQRNIEEPINTSELEIIDASIDATKITNTEITEEFSEKFTDFDTTPLEITPIRRIEHLPIQNKNNEDDSSSDTTETKVIQSTEKITVKIVNDFETKASEITPIRKRERLAKHNKNKEESVIKTELDTVDSLIITTDITTNQSNENQEILTDSEINTPIHRRERISIQNKNNEKSDISEPEKVDTPIVKKEIVTNQSIENVNEKLQILTDSVTNIPVSTPIRKRGRKPKQNKNDEDSISKSIVSTEIKTYPSIENVNKKQEILSDSETKTPVSPPIRRKGRPPKQNQNKEDSCNKSKSETVVASSITETKTNEAFEEIYIKQEVLTEPELITPTRRRGRPAKVKKNIQDSEPDNSPIVTTEMKTNKSSEEITDADTTPASKHGRGRRKNDVEEIQQEKEENSSKKEAKYVSIPGRGRKRNRQEMEKDTTPNKSKKVTCAICNEEVDRVQWVNHTMKHNFLCWQVGQPAIDLKDKKLVEYTLFKGFKDNKRFTQFICPTCSDKKKSVLGFMAHIEVCQLTEEERLAIMQTCTVCQKKVMPQSMKSHMRIHDDFMKRGIVEEQLKEEDLLAPRGKRKAAAKAANLIQEVTNEDDAPVSSKNEKGKKHYKKALEKGSVFFTYGIVKKLHVEFNKGATKCKFINCTFQCEDFAEMKLHLNACPTLNSDDYICRYCLYVDQNENKMKNHVQTKHLEMEDKEDYRSDPSASESDDDADGDYEIMLSDEDTNSNSNLITAKRLSKPPAEYIKPTYKIGFLARERRMIREPVSTYLPALRWTYEFCQENYSQVLFENIKCFASKWSPMRLNEKQKYIPRLNKSMSVKSCSIANKIPNLQNKEHQWKEYDLYESNLENDTATIFCGGPIWALAWVPTPLDIISDQYLAVSLQKDFEANYKISESPCGREVIQFWNFGPLECKVPLKNAPQLEFSIAHNHGMIWCMEWCASGYYDTDNPSDSNELKKLGLLALACSDGNIPIYAIGVPPENERNKNNIFEIKPAFKLILQEPMEQLLGRWKYQVTKISWTRSTGHNIIAGGYSNGVVCLWDLENHSPLLRSQENDVIILKPYLSFQAHTSAISALILYPLIDEGKRWLLTGSWDRTFKYWDVNNTATPISTYGKRGTVTDGVWISHWICTFFAYDDVFSLGHTVTTVQNPRDFSFKQCSALASNSVVMSLSASDWASAVAQGTLAGELTTTFPRTILMSYDVDKHLKCKRMMLSYSEIIDKTKDPSERKDIMKSEKKPERIDNEKDDKIFSRYFDTKDIEPYVEEPNTYEKAREKYGMLFCDFKLNQFGSLPLESLDAVRQSSRLREVPTEMYPFTSLNRLVWNPNKQAYLYVACGYQNGFLRLSPLGSQKLLKLQLRLNESYCAPSQSSYIFQDPNDGDLK